MLITFHFPLREVLPELYLISVECLEIKLLSKSNSHFGSVKIKHFFPALEPKGKEETGKITRKKKVYRFSRLRPNI